MGESRDREPAAAWAPRSWGAGLEGSEVLDTDPQELARRIRAHRARGDQGLIDFGRLGVEDLRDAGDAP